MTAQEFLEAIFWKCSGHIESRTTGRGARLWAKADDPEDIRRLLNRSQVLHTDYGLDSFYGCATRTAPGSGRRADCLHLGCLFVDIDLRDGASEKAALQCLAGCPLKPSIVVHSGGGLHAYWLLRQPIDVQKEAPEPWLRRLAAFLNADPACAEAARVLRIPGTRNFKEQYGPEGKPVEIGWFEPNRRYHLDWFDSFLPDDIGKPADIQEPDEPIDYARVEQIPVADRVSRARRYVWTMEPAVEGQGGDEQTFKVAAVIARDFGLPQEEAFQLLSEWNRERALPPWSEGDLKRKLASAILYGTRDIGRKLLEKPDEPVLLPGSQSGLTLARPLKTVRTKPVDWLWYRRLALGKLTILAGVGGIGKSGIYRDIVARLSRGLPFPDGWQTEPGRSVILPGEEDLSDTLVPGLQAAGCDLGMVGSGEHPDGRPWHIVRDLPAIEQYLSETGTKLLVIDPIGSYLPAETDANSDHQVRAVLKPLVDMAGRCGTAVLAIMHFRKDERASGANRLLNSVGFQNTARVVLGAVRDPQDQNRILIGNLKTNYLPSPTLAFRMETCLVEGDEGGPIETYRLAWEDEPVNADVDELMRQRAQQASSGYSADEDRVLRLFKPGQLTIRAKDATTVLQGEGWTEHRW
jgi:hypothetical protein